MKVDQVIDAIMIAIKPNVCERTAIQIKKSLMHLAIVARAEDQVPLRCIAECSQAINKAMRSSRTKE